ncbi:MAG: DUF4349 domain-containing protein [Clostridia bacterium]
MEQADTLDSIIALESRLTEVRYELEAYMSQLRTYDNQVEYSYITMNIAEVERLVEVQERPSLWTRMKNGLSDTMHSIARGAENFAVWFVVNLPYLRSSGRQRLPSAPYFFGRSRGSGEFRKPKKPSPGGRSREKDPLIPLGWSSSQNGKRAWPKLSGLGHAL